MNSRRFKRSNCIKSPTRQNRIVVYRIGEDQSGGSGAKIYNPPAVGEAGSMSELGVRRNKAALSSGCKSHPATAPAGSNRSSYGGNEVVEAFGERVTIYGDSASVQAVTRVNAKQASKRTMHRPTRLPYRGRLTRLGRVSEAVPPVG